MSSTRRKSRGIAALPILLLLGSAAFAQPQELVDQFERRSQTLDGFTLNYRLFVPPDYDSGQSYPLVLALHGSGERGDDNERHIANHRLATAWADPVTQAKHPSIVVAPQAPGGGTWNSNGPDEQIRPELATAFAIVDSLSVELNVDPDRIYITGLSLGGYATFEAVGRSPDRFAAAIPMSGGSRPEFAPNFEDVPFWILHGEVDDQVPVQRSRRMVTAFEELGRDALYTHCGPLGTCSQLSGPEFDAALVTHPNLIFTGLADGGHVIWQPWYDNPRLQDWLFAQHRLVADAIDIETPSVDPGDQTLTSIRWSAPDPGNSLELWFRAHPGDSWALISDSVANDGAFELATGDLPDTPVAQVRLLLVDDDGFVYARSESDLFSINADGDGAPYVDVFDYPFRSNEELTDSLLSLQYLAADVESDTLGASLMYSVDGGATFAVVSTFEIENNSAIRDLPVDLRSLPNSGRAVFRLEIDDGVSQSSDQTPAFSKQTPRLSSTEFDHTMGGSSGAIVVNFVSPSDLTGHRYRVTFDIQDDGAKTYSVTDLDLNQAILTDLPVIGAESPVFDGIRLLVSDLDRASVDHELSMWSNSSVTLAVNVSAPRVNIGGGARNLLATPEDYSLTITADVADTSSPLFGFPAKEMRFSIENLTAGGLRNVLFADPSGDGYPNVGETLYILEPDKNDELFPSWLLSFSAAGPTVPPGPGDVYSLVTRKPITSSDVFEFVGMVPVSAASDELPAAFSLSQNYPNPFSSYTTINYAIESPQRVRISLHDALGRTVEHLVDGQLAAGTHSVEVRAGGLASGVYFYRMETGGAVETRKMLVIH